MGFYDTLGLRDTPVHKNTKAHIFFQTVQYQHCDASCDSQGTHELIKKKFNTLKCTVSQFE